MRKWMIAIVCAVSLFAAGCGQSGKNVQTTSDTESAAVDSRMESVPQDTESVADAVMDSNVSAVDKGSVVPDEKPDSKVAKATDNWVDVTGLEAGAEVVTDSTVGEGFNVIPGEIVEIADSSKEIKIGDTITVDTPQGSFDLTIDSIGLTDERSAGIPADRVVEVVYTYTNAHDYPDLFVGELSFMMTDAQGRALASYIFDPTNGKHPQPMPIASGESLSISIGFILPGDAGDEVTLLYRSNYETEDYFGFSVKAVV